MQTAFRYASIDVQSSFTPCRGSSHTVFHSDANPRLPAICGCKKWLWRLAIGRKKIETMPQSAIRVTRGIFFLSSLIVLGMVDGATFPAQTARRKLSRQARTVLPSRIEGARGAQETGEKARESKDPYGDIDPSAFDMRLIVPHAPLCWSHAQAENPQRSQDNGEAIESAGRGASLSGAGADPLMGPTAAAAQAKTRMKPPCRGTLDGTRPNSGTGRSPGRADSGRPGKRCAQGG